MKIKTPELIGAALDWAVAKCEGLVVREPVQATNADVEHLAVPFTLYDVEYVWKDGKYIGGKVHPIKVIRYGINTDIGATAPSISFIDHKGRRAQGSVDCYYLQVEEAELDASIVGFASLDEFHPSTNWLQGGSIIDGIKGFEFKQWLESKSETCCEAHIHNYEGNWIEFGPTPLIAAMRCYVASKLGDEVDIPDEVANA